MLYFYVSVNRDWEIYHFDLFGRRRPGLFRKDFTLSLAWRDQMLRLEQTSPNDSLSQNSKSGGKERETSLRRDKFLNALTSCPIFQSLFESAVERRVGPASQ
ncbi:hypothetical protein CDAR_227331 [Caerostris darwini]|uniref:Uncharacterized protein n=1 Tax=Caerostris darwini TaxID=1538125 RepID=A0AAV4ULP6_9ARAC|nr:hypothetical protein CDAR_227331 [Caerostris darwini]